MIAGSIFRIEYEEVLDACCARDKYMYVVGEFDEDDDYFTKTGMCTEYVRYVETDIESRLEAEPDVRND